jgi:CRP/FNR family transcriptional regulator
MLDRSRHRFSLAPGRRNSGGVLSYHLSLLGFFRGLDDAQLGEIARECSLQFVEPGGDVDLGGETAHSVAFVVSGALVSTVLTEANRPIRLRAGTGEMFGAEAVFSQHGLPVRLTADEPSTVILMHRATLVAVVGRHPEILLRLVEAVSGRYHAIVEQMAEFATLSVRERLVGELLRRSRPLTGGGAEIGPTITHSILAQAIGTNRETVSRELSRLQVAGIVARTRRGLIIRDVAELQRLGGPQDWRRGAGDAAGVSLRT